MIKAALVVLVLAATTATMAACRGSDSPSNTVDAGSDTKSDATSYDTLTDTGAPGTDTSASDTGEPEDTYSPPDDTSDTGLIGDVGECATDDDCTLGLICCPNEAGTNSCVYPNGSGECP